MGSDLDYINVLKGLTEIPFNVGKKLLVDFLTGNPKNESIVRNRLDTSLSFGSLCYTETETEQLIDKLMSNGFIKSVTVPGKRFWKVLGITPKGVLEIKTPTLNQKKFSFKEAKTKITDEDKAIFDNFKEFLDGFNDEQKKAVICGNSHILSIAGAGSGKTTVLTKRIEFLIKYKSIDPSKILAITFTRKAKQQMVEKLDKLGIYGARVETFNSFCEQFLRTHNDLIYDRQVKVINYADRFKIISSALRTLGITMDMAIATYFSAGQRRFKTSEQLKNIFMNDCFFIRDYSKFKGRELDESSFKDAETAHKRSAEIVGGICNYIEGYMKKNGLRDFADQLVDTIKCFKENSSLIPSFEHILVDEYQDVNSTQIKFIDLLNSPSLFCVGDPRQSIYGWRGSDIKYILNFSTKYPECSIITLTKNYRSGEKIVNLINSSIKDMGLANLESSAGKEGSIHLLKFGTEKEEFAYVAQGIKMSEYKRNDIFVLARTNRQLKEFSKILRSKKIDCVLRTDDTRGDIIVGENDVTLATVHSIKGLEASLVFVIGCTSMNYPCKGSEHPVIEMIKVDEYDKEEEEKRLFYVAMSRAKEKLVMTYFSKNPTFFITNEMLLMFGKEVVEKEIKQKKLVKTKQVKNKELFAKLKEWRLELARQHKVPAYIIMHDATLIEIISLMPATISDLDSVSGMGPIKISRYGQSLLDVVNS